MQNWTAKADLTLEVNETGGISPSFQFIQPLKNAFFLGAGPSTINNATGAVTNVVAATAQNLTVGFGANYSGEAVRTETLSFTVSLLELKDWKENEPMTISGQAPSELYRCEPHGVTDLQGGLELKEWLDEALDPVERGYLTTGLHPDPGAKATTASAGAKPAAKAQYAEVAGSNTFRTEKGDKLSPEDKARYDLLLTVFLNQLGVPYLRPNQDPVNPNPKCDFDGTLSDGTCKKTECDPTDATCKKTVAKIIPRYIANEIVDGNNCVTELGKSGEPRKPIVRFAPAAYVAPSSSGASAETSPGSSKAASGSSGSLQQQALAAAQSAASANGQAAVSKILSDDIKGRVNDAAREARRAAMEVERASHFAALSIYDACRSERTYTLHRENNEASAELPPKGDDDCFPRTKAESKMTSGYAVMQLDASYCSKKGYQAFLDKLFNEHVSQAEANEVVATQNSTIATKLLTPDPPIQSLGQSINFVVTTGVSASPSWSLLHWKGPGAASGGNLASLSGIRTHTLNIALGQPTEAGVTEVQRVLNNQATRDAIMTLQ